MKNRTKSLLIVILSIAVMIMLAIVDISDNGGLTTGFLGMFVLILGTLIMPTILELIKEKRK